MKNKYNFFNMKTMSFLLIASFLYIAPVFINGFTLGDDVGFHMSRFHYLIAEIRTDSIFPFVFSNMNSSLGYAVGTYYPNFFLYIFALLPFIGVSEYMAFSLYYVFISEIGIIVFYFSAKSILISVKKEKYRFYLGVSIVLYYLNIYTYENFYNRGALGEFTAAVFLPLIFLACYKIFTQNSGYKLLGFAVACIFLSHLITAFIVVLCLGVFYLFNINKLRRKILIVKNTAITALCVVLVTAFQWIPMIETYMKTDLYFLHNQGLLGTLQDNIIFKCGENTVVGIVLVVLLTVYVVFCHSANNRLIQAISVYVFLNSSLFPWVLLNNIFGCIQFPWRFTNVLYYLIIFSFIRVLIESKFELKEMAILVMVMFLILNQIGFKSYFCYASVGKCSKEYIETVDNVGLMEYAPLAIVKDKMLDENYNFSREKYAKRKQYNLAEINGANTETVVFDTETHTLNTGDYSGDIKVPMIFYPGATAVSKTLGVQYKAKNSDYGFIEINDVCANDTIIIKYCHTSVQIFGFVLSGIVIIILLFKIIKDLLVSRRSFCYKIQSRKSHLLIRSALQSYRFEVSSGYPYPTP